MKRIASLIVLFFRSFFIIAYERPNVIHTHSVDMAFFMSFAARFFRIPIIHTFHIVTFYDSSQPLLRRKTEILLVKGARPYVITAPNMHDVKKLRQAGLKKVALLPNGVDLEMWRIRGYTEKSPVFTFVTVGRLEQQKGYDYLIKAAALLKSYVDMPFRIIVVGEGSQEKALIALAKSLQVDEYFMFVGRKTPRQIKQLFSEAHATVFPSLYETTPITLLEAWAAGNPVVITKVGLMRDVSSDFSAAFVVPPMDEAMLANGLKECMENISRREKAVRHGREEAKKYAWPTVAERAGALYAEAQ